MTSKESLEKVMKTKVEPIIDHAMQKYLGIKIDKISDDISDKLGSNKLIHFAINTDIPFKTAKKMFKKDFLVKLIQTNYCNISKVAEILDINRRTIHRIIGDLGIDIKSIRKQMLRPTYYKQEMVDSVVRDVLENYKSILHPKKIQAVYDNVERLSESIAKELANQELTLKQAEEYFEKEYLKRAILENNGNLTATSKKIKLRYETLLRKARKLGL